MSRRLLSILYLFICIYMAGCGPVEVGADSALERWRSAESSTVARHAVWEVRWCEGPVQEAIAAEVWAEGADRLRIEVLQAPHASMEGVTYIRNGDGAMLYEPLGERTTPGGSLPIVQDALNTVEMLAADGCDAATYAGRSHPEAGPADKLRLSCEGGADAVTLWVDDETGLASGLESDSERYGCLSLKARSIEALDGLDGALFELNHGRIN